MLFTSVVRRARLHNPMKNFELEEQQIEYRIDPLTGENTLITPGRAEYMRKYFVEGEEALRRFFEESGAGCPSARRIFGQRLHASPQISSKRVWLSWVMLWRFRASSLMLSIML